uniref:Integrase zinc-binding domain-containing protein n=1 Tax=Trichogramma kaykai TaxID=54128 RepID=A0ABD2W9U9_9HYME
MQSSSNSSSKKQQSGSVDRSSAKKKASRTGDQVKQPMKNKKGEFRCYNCQGYRHISEDCSQPKADPYCVGYKVNFVSQKATSREIGMLRIIREEDEMQAFQYRDEDIDARRKALRKAVDEHARMEMEMVKDLVIVDSVLYKRSNDKLCYVVPKCMRKSLVVRFHDYSGHQGLELMSRKYYFRGMRRYTKQHIHPCFQCLAANMRPGRQLGELHPFPPGCQLSPKLSKSQITTLGLTN